MNTKFEFIDGMTLPSLHVHEVQAGSGRNGLVPLDVSGPWSAPCRPGGALDVSQINFGRARRTDPGRRRRRDVFGGDGGSALGPRRARFPPLGSPALGPFARLRRHREFGGYGRRDVRIYEGRRYGGYGGYGGYSRY